MIHQEVRWRPDNGRHPLSNPAGCGKALRRIEQQKVKQLSPDMRARLFYRDESALDPSLPPAIPGKMLSMPADDGLFFSPTRSRQFSNIRPTVLWLLAHYPTRVD